MTVKVESAVRILDTFKILKPCSQHLFDFIKNLTSKISYFKMVAFDSAKANSISDNLDSVDLQAEESSNSTDNLEADEDLTLADDEKENVNDDLNGRNIS